MEFPIVTKLLALRREHAAPILVGPCMYRDLVLEMSYGAPPLGMIHDISILGPVGKFPVKMTRPGWQPIWGVG